MNSVALWAVGEVCSLKDDGGRVGDADAVTRNQGDVGGAVAVVVVESGFKDWRASGRSLPVECWWPRDGGRVQVMRCSRTGVVAGGGPGGIEGRNGACQMDGYHLTTPFLPSNSQGSKTPLAAPLTFSMGQLT
jgi:hypothetical protein